MGKIRIKHVGFGGIEQEEKKKAQKRRQTKKEKKKTARAPGLKGGERVVAVGPTPEELEKEIEKGSTLIAKPEGRVEPSKKTKPAQLRAKKGPRTRSTRYQKLAKLVDRNKLYSPTEALKLLKKMANTSFTGTVEAHINLKRVAGKSEQAVWTKQLVSAERWRSDSLQGNGKFAGHTSSSKKRGGKFSLSELNKSPTSASGTYERPLQAGHEPALQAETRRQLDSQPALSLHFEKKIPLAHAVLGKVDEPAATLEKNLETLIKKVGGLANIKKLTLSSTMSPSIKLAFSKN